MPIPDNPFERNIPWMGNASDFSPLVRQPKTRCAEIDALSEAAYDAYERDEVVRAMYGFVMADLRGLRTYADEIMACVAKWHALGCPQQDDTLDDEFTEDHYGLGWAALLWFSQTMPEQAIDWIIEASRNGNRMARMFGFKFMGSRLYHARSERDYLRDIGIGSPNAIAVILIIVAVLLGLLLVFVGYICTHVSYPWVH